jgi:phosphonate transport system substrate-binding protein
MHYLRSSVIFILIGLCSLPAFALQGKPLRFGSVARDSLAVMQVRLLPLTAYLSKSLGLTVELRLSTNMSRAINALSSGNVDIAYLTPVAYIKAHAKGKAQLVVRTVTDYRPSFKLMIIVRQDSPIHTVQQLAGKRFAFGDPAALLQRAVVVGAGMPLQRLGKYSFVDHYDNVVRGVLVGDYDAGIVLDSTARRWEGRGIRVLYASENLPPYNIAVSSKIDHATVKRLRDALLRLDVSTPADMSIIHTLDQSYTGFAPATDADYDIVRKLIKPFSQ